MNDRKTAVKVVFHRARFDLRGELNHDARTFAPRDPDGVLHSHSVAHSPNDGRLREHARLMARLTITVRLQAIMTCPSVPGSSAGMSCA